jgi:hypothetical protein
MTEQKTETSAAPEETAQVADTASTEAQQQPAGPELNINDLVALKSIVEVATQRGAFKAGELEAVGKTFNKLSQFLDATAQPKEE